MPRQDNPGIGRTVKDMEKIFPNKVRSKKRQIKKDEMPEAYIPPPTTHEIIAENGGTPQDWQDLFINALCQKPIIAYACRYAKVSRAQVRTEREKNPAFEEAVLDALEEGRDNLEESNLSMALSGNTGMGIYLMKAWRYGGADIALPKTKDGKTLTVGWID